MASHGSWRELLDHDGYVVIQLRLRPFDDGGPKRELASGYRADWIWHGGPAMEPGPRPLRAPVDVVTADEQCIRPGAVGLVRAHPFEPELWADLHVGTTIELCRLKRSAPLGYTVIGAGSVMEVVDVPDHPVPLRPMDRPLRPGQAILVRRASWGDRNNPDSA